MYCEYSAEETAIPPATFPLSRNGAHMLNTILHENEKNVQAFLRYPDSRALCMCYCLPD
jgi:chaperone required for assembly of F1-ATPase